MVKLDGGDDVGCGVQRVAGAAADGQARLSCPACGRKRRGAMAQLHGRPVSSCTRHWPSLLTAIWHTQAARQRAVGGGGGGPPLGGTHTRTLLYVLAGAALAKDLGEVPVQRLGLLPAGPAGWEALSGHRPPGHHGHWAALLLLTFGRPALSGRASRRCHARWAAWEPRGAVVRSWGAAAHNDSRVQVDGVTPGAWLGLRGAAMSGVRAGQVQGNAGRAHEAPSCTCRRRRCRHAGLALDAPLLPPPVSLFFEL